MNNLVTQDMVDNAKAEISTSLTTAQNSIKSLNSSIDKLEEDIDTIIQGGIWETEEDKRQQALNTMLENIKSCRSDITNYYSLIGNLENINIGTHTEYKDI